MKFVTDIFAKSGLIVDGSVTLNTTPNANVDTDKFLVQDGLVVKYRTGAEVLSDIGAQGAITLTVIGNSGPSTLIGNGLNIPTYTLAGLGGVPLTRTITINGTTQDLSSDRIYSVGTVTSVDFTAPTGFSVSGNPITSSGIISLNFASGYSLPTTASQLNWDSAYNNMITAISYNTSTGDITLTQQDLGTLTTTVTLQPFTTTNLAEGTNLYYTDARARQAISLTTTGNSGASTYTTLTGVLNVPTYTLAGLGGVPTTRTITINGNSQDLSADRTWSVGTVTSVDLSVPTGFAISGNPVTSSGTLALAYAGGYALPTLASQSNWNNAYNNTITAISYNTSTGEIVLTQQDLGTLSAFVTLQPFTTTNLVEGTNLYYTDARARLTLSASVGISYNNLTGVITNSAPDQTVVLTGGGTTVITGTYPNFTITSNDSYIGTVTSVAALTLGTTGTDLSSSVANSTTTPVITLNVPTASAVNRGALSSTDWSTFNAKQNAITLTTTGNSGSSTLIGATLNIPTYTLSGLGGVPSTRTINGLALSSDQTFAVGTTGTDFNIVSAGTVHTFNIPDASGSNRGLITAGSQTIAGTKTFTSSPIVPSLYLSNMGAGSGAVYYNVSENRLTLANYNVGGEIKFEVNGGVYTMELNSDLTIELKGYTTDGFLKTSGGTGLLVVDTTTYTPTTRTLTINGTSYDLSANRTWSVGTVTSVGLSVPTGFSVASTPVTSSGTIALSFASGYSLPTNASQTNWDTAYNSRISSLTTTGTSGAATLVANVLNIPQYQAQGNYITALTGEATASGPGSASVTLTNSAVIGKVLTGLSVTSGAIASTDSILQAFGKVQGQINALSGGLIFQGTWNANTNTPTITSGVGSLGYFYIVNVAGNTTIDGNTGWQVGDWILFDGTVWQKVDNTDAVTSVNGQTGAVVLTTTNISEGTNLYYTDTRARLAISLTTTGSSGAATYTSGTGVLNIPQYTLSGLGGVPTGRTLTINGTAYDLSADRSWSVGTVTSIATSGPITGGTITGSGTIGITQATSTTNGYLSSTDWNTFNNKQNAITLTVTGSSGPATLVGATLNIPEYTLSGLGGVPSTRTLTINGTSYDLSANRTWSVGTVTSITFSGPLTGGTITGSGTVGITQASGAASGYLSSTDWTTFNNKQNAITLTTTGSSGASTFVGATLNIPTYTLSGLGGVPTSRTLTINGTAYDLSADRSWSVGTVTSVAATAGSGISISGSPITGSGTLTITNTGVTSLTAGTGISVSASTGGITITNTAPSPANTVTGTGTTSYVARWTSSSTIGTGVLYDNGTNVGVGTISPLCKLHIKGDAVSSVGLTLIQNDYASGNVYYPTLSVINTRGNHSYGNVAEFRTNTAGDNDRPSILFYGAQVAASWQVGQVTSGWGNNDAFGIGYRASNTPSSFASWPTNYFTILTNGNVGISVSTPANNLQIGSMGSVGYGGNHLAIGNGSGGAFAIWQETGRTNIYTSTFYSFQLSGSGTGNFVIASTTDSGLAKLQVTGAIQQTSVTSSMLKVNSSGVLVAAIAGTDYLTSTSSDFSYAASLTLSTTWQDTGVSATNLSTSGVYLVTCALSDFAVGGGQYTETYVGMMYWYASTTNGSDVAEIPLHHSGHADNNRYIYLRTRIDPAASTGKIYLQIRGNGTNSGASTYTFTFKRLM